MPTLLTATQAYQIIDLLVSDYVAQYGDGAWGFGDGSWGSSLYTSDLKDLIQGVSVSSFRDIDIQLALGGAARTLSNYTIDSAFANRWSGFFSVFSSYCANSRSVDSSIVDLDTFLKWYNWTNGVTFWQCLAPPEFRDAYYALRGAYPDAKNVYFAALDGGAVLGEATPDGLYRTVLPATNTAGYIIDPTKYVGGEAWLKWTSGGGSGAISISVAGLNHSGAAETWTASGTWGVAPFNAASGEVELTPGTAGALITKVTAAPTISGLDPATDCVIEARAPSGRTYPMVEPI